MGAISSRPGRSPACRWARRTVVSALVAGASLACLRPPAGAADGVAWDQWQHLPGVVDLSSPRSDGNLVAVAAGLLYLVAPDGTDTPFAPGADGFSGSVDGEPYLVVSPGLTVGAAGCSFAPDDVYALDLGSPPGVIRVDASGHASQLASIPQVETLGGIAFDTTGGFGNRLLVSGTRQNQEMVFAVDCQGAVATIADTAPTIEGGRAVAPASFGAFAGSLIGADENSDQVWAISPDGRATLVLKPGLPTGGDTGVESLGFVPPGFSAGGSAYLADRATANNPFPGTDSILRLTSQVLAAAGVQDGDLLVSTEGGGRTVAIRCADTCSVLSVADGPGDGHTGHIEGHVVFGP